MRALRTVATLTVLLGAAIGAAAPVCADDYPNRPVRVMVGFIPGAAAPEACYSDKIMRQHMRGPQ
jgi:hypothetical protein